MGNTDKAATKKRICILGAGPAGLASAYGLSATEELRSQYDITIYQVGWRAGGKCATGRQGSEHYLEQNCPHYLFGCYANTFHMMRAIFEELPGSGVHEFGVFDDILLDRNLIALKQKFKGKWHTWLIEFPGNSAVPGEGSEEFLELRYVIPMMLEWILEGIFGWKFLNKFNAYDYDKRKHDLPPQWTVEHNTGRYLLERLVAWSFRGVLGISKHRKPGRAWPDKSISWILKRVRSFVWWLEKDKVDDSLDSLRKWQAFDFGCSMIIGMLDDNVLQPGGFESIDKYDYREWLAVHGASKYACDSPMINLWYQNSLAFVGGDTSKPSMSAGVSLIGQLFASLNYRGAAAYSLQYEIGDSFISPMYLALKNRGVKFEFFHRLRELKPDSSGKKVERIIIEKQVELRSELNGEYDPLMKIDGWPCWPNSPDSSQFCEADKKRFEEGDYNLESYYTQWRGSHPDVVLKAGQDFDRVIFAIPHGVIPYYCKEFYETNPIWSDLVDNSPMVESQSLRLWFKPNLCCLGWPYPQPILSGYEMPYCTWEDDGQLVASENWPPDKKPGSIACVFGPLQAPLQAPGPDDYNYMPVQSALVEQQSDNFIQNLATGIWPKVGSPENPDGIDPELLIQQSIRPNSGPLERYTMTWPGGLKWRPTVDGSGVDNLLFAGDWVRNGVEAGSIEGATMAGLEASRVICGSPQVIFGEHISYG